MVTIALANQANAARLAGSLDRAALTVGEALRCQREEERPWSLALALMVHGDIAREKGDAATALAAYRQTLSVAVSYGDRARWAML